MMKTYFLVAMILACWTVQIQGQDDDVEDAWKSFKEVHNVKDDQEEKSKANFVKTHNNIKKPNSRKDATFQMGHSKFSVMDDEEKRQYISAFSPSPLDESRYLHVIDNSDSSNERQIASSIDYRSHPCMSAIKDQGQCGSCWAFAATSVVEFGTCILNGTKVSLSEQQLVDCIYTAGGCNGGSYVKAWGYVATLGYQVTAASYPYTAKNSTCKTPSIAYKGATILKNPYATPNLNATTIMNYLNKNTLVAVSFIVIDSFFYYQSGVYSIASCTTTTTGYAGWHAVVVVGYGTDSVTGLNYWVMRNSWGTYWGNMGYFLFRRGTNMCSVETYASTTTVVS